MHFTFFSNKEEQFNGYFDKLIKDSVPILTFTNLYQISIERRIIKEAGSPESKIRDIIISNTEIEE